MGEFDNGNNDTDTVGARVILQQCMSAELMVQPATDTDDAKYVQIGKGLIVYLCFMKGATEKTVDKMANYVLNVRLSEAGLGHKISVLDLGGDVLIIPQSTLGGSPRGKKITYHHLLDKEHGQKLFTKFVQLCEETMKKSNKCNDKRATLKTGTYGNKVEVFSIASDGPFSHFLEF